jgi:uncharacterized protein YkwD
VKTTRFLILLVLTMASTSLSFEALAANETPYDLVNAVNGLRASNGLEPYKIDPWLMAYAQEHSEYQAATHTSTHVHRDGKLPQAIGLQENVAGGDEGVVTVSIVVNEIWVDWGHRHILTGYSNGEIGAGVALSDNGQIYYTVDIRPGKEAETVSPKQDTPVPFMPNRTSTPDENGSISHTVTYGQTLWGIAQSYGVKIDDLRRLNRLAANSTIIQVGQKLLVRPAYTATPVLITETSSAPARMANPSPSITALISPVNPGEPASLPSGSATKNMGWMAIFAIGPIGVLVVILVVFRRSHK